MAMGYDPDFQDLPAKGVDRFRGKREPASLAGLWTWVYIANLPFPAFMGSFICYGTGLLGMVAGAALLYGEGRRSCGRHPWAVGTVCYGGVFVAIAQLVPIFHMLAGMLGVGVAGYLTRQEVRGGSNLGPTGALIATVVTGLLLIAWALVAGLIIRAAIHAAVWIHREVDGRWAGAEKV